MSLFAKYVQDVLIDVVAAALGPSIDTPVQENGA
jgi:hypothetical protein